MEGGSGPEGREIGRGGLCHILTPFPGLEALYGILGLAPAILLTQIQVGRLGLNKGTNIPLLHGDFQSNQPQH